MARLHRLSRDEARRAGVPQVDSYSRLLGARDVVMPVLAERLEREARARVQAWWDALAADDRMRTERLAVCHHDLWHDNLLRSDEGRLSGVLDMAHVEIGDPAHDFAAPRYFGQPFLEELIAAYHESGGAYDAEDACAGRLWEGGSRVHSYLRRLAWSKRVLRLLLEVRTREAFARLEELCRYVVDDVLHGPNVVDAARDLARRAMLASLSPPT
jgi:aminoglycoside phosphotransferase (APT) family kinase protein